jgi:CII-binding regulator of phage lambda lysogenization HflD
VLWDPNEAIIEKLETGFRFMKDMDGHIGSMDGHIQAMDGHVQKMHGDLKEMDSHLSTKLDVIADGQHQMSRKLDVIAENQERFAAQTNQQFALLASSYGRISKDLRAVLKQMQVDRREARKDMHALIRAVLAANARSAKRT